jgi:hypothetical protein
VIFGGTALKSITELIVRIADLAEAEGRALRKAAARLGLSLSLMVVAAILILIGGLAILAGIWLGLRETIPHGWAAVATGMLALALAGVLLWAASKLNK